MMWVPASHKFLCSRRRKKQGNGPQKVIGVRTSRPLLENYDASKDHLMAKSTENTA